MSYVKKTWQSGDTVTSSALNSMETGIDNSANPFIVTLTPTAQDFSGTMDKTVAEINTAWQAGKTIKFNVVLDASTTVLVDCNAITVFDVEGYYPKFSSYVIYPEQYMLIYVSCGDTQTGTDDTYSTTIYPLTPMS